MLLPNGMYIVMFPKSLFVCNSHLHACKTPTDTKRHNYERQGKIKIEIKKL